MAGKAKKKEKTMKNGTAPGENLGKSVNFVEQPMKRVHTAGLKPSPSQNTLDRLDRDKIVFWSQPRTTFCYMICEIVYLIIEFVQSVLQRKLLLLTLGIFSALGYYLYVTPGVHQVYVVEVEKNILWWSWWVLLGVLSSIGLGSGLHTFLIYLGPHIAAVTLAAYECNSLDFPEPPYPESIVCPNGGKSTSTIISLLQIVAKVRVESLLWGAGTAIGELPPYFMARAARLSGQEPDDEEYQEFIALMNPDKRKGNELSWSDRGKAMVERMIARLGFPLILLFASIPNPLFDLAGITCGHFNVPFWSFFGATLIGKAIVKMHVQMLFVIIAFSEHHVENVLNIVAKIPVFGENVRQPVAELLRKQKQSLHRTAGTPVEQSASMLQMVLSTVVTLMILAFLLSIVNSLAQRYHKRLCQAKKKTL